MSGINKEMIDLEGMGMYDHIDCGEHHRLLAIEKLAVELVGALENATGYYGKSIQPQSEFHKAKDTLTRAQALLKEADDDID